ncbi:uncharacterized protein [Antedon mediterranea]|uniref:uncharacterized protein n=1 Tax=Antedon mediterranea TaxID=105859 RepID=UPI003AF7C8DE
MNLQTVFILVSCLWATVGPAVKLVVAGDQEIGSSSTETGKIFWRQKNFNRRQSNNLRYGLRIDSRSSSSSSKEVLNVQRNFIKIRNRPVNSISRHGTPEKGVHPSLGQRTHIKRTTQKPNTLYEYVHTTTNSLSPATNHAARKDNSYVDVCNSNPCKNNGICFNYVTHFLCFCKPPYIGKMCHRIDFCASRPCKNGGMCRQIGNNYSCKCHKQYTGTHCEHKDPCLPNLCQNEAICLSESGSFQCQCQEGYLGEFCETENPCLPNPCSNNGHCHITGQSFSCECTMPYTGQLCEVIADFQMFMLPNQCLSDPCQNKGVCTAAIEGDVHCHCYPEYKGIFCEHPAEYPAKIGSKLTDLLFWSKIDVANMMSSSTFFAPIDSVLSDIHTDYLSNKETDESDLSEFILRHTVSGYRFLKEDIVDKDERIILLQNNKGKSPTLPLQKVTQLQSQLEKICGRVIDSDEYKGQSSIFIIDKILTIPSKNIMEVLLTDARFTRFFEYAQYLTRIIQILSNANEESPVTLLVPTNSAIDAIPEEVLGDRRQIRWILMYHIILGHVCFPRSSKEDSDEYIELEMYTETQDVVLLQSINGNKLVNDVTVIESDVVARNGVIHYIENVLDSSYVKS